MILTDAPLVLALGDSLTAGYGLAGHEGFARQLEARLQERWRDARVFNAGVSGDTSAGGLARLPSILSRVERAPDLCLVELGANDAIRGIDPGRTEANLLATLAMLAERSVPALLAGIAAPSFLGSYAVRFNAVFPAVAARAGVPLDPDFLTGVAGRHGLTLRDGIHPNARAVSMIADRLAPVIERLLTANQARAAA